MKEGGTAPRGGLWWLTLTREKSSWLAVDTLIHGCSAFVGCILTVDTVCIEPIRDEGSLFSWGFRDKQRGETYPKVVAQFSFACGAIEASTFGIGYLIQPLQLLGRYQPCTGPLLLQLH